MRRTARVRLPLAVACVLVLGLSGCPAPKAPPVNERPRVAVVREHAGAARIDGLGPIQGFATGRDCTFVHCLEIVLNGLGRHMSYDELMGASGLAFRLQVRVDRWDVGNPDPLVGASCADAMFKAAGWGYDLRVVRREQLADAESLRDDIVKSIDAGLPVIAANIIPPEDWGIITGYERGGWGWLCRAYHGGAQSLDRAATGWPTAVVLLNRRSARPAVKGVHVDSIRQAVRLFDMRSYDVWAVGRNAFEHWSQMLRSADQPRYVHPNIWTYIGLIDARGAAVRYLRSIADDFGAHRQDILAAASTYEEEVRMLIAGLGDVPSERQFPDTVPPAEMRMRQVSTLQNARNLEERAIESLKKAL